MYTPRFPLRLALLGLLLSELLAPVAATRATGAACSPETGICVQGRFLAYWQQHGGLAINGYPLSNERQELLEDGKTYTVQYFERVRMEYHPENAPPDDVLLGLLGRRAVPYFNSLVRVEGVTSPRPPEEGYTYFPQTGHNLGTRFLAYWEANGGLAQFGYPITEEFSIPFIEGDTNQRRTPNGVVQYFERVRLEYHPANAGTPDEIQLGQIGRVVLTEVEQLKAAPDFFTRYTTDRTLRERLGIPLTAPRGDVVETPGTTQSFEHGRMFYLERGGPRSYPEPGPPAKQLSTRVIYALCGDVQAGQWFPFTDTWAEGQPVGGGPGPQPGLFAPQRGFGTVWRERAEVQHCLGYATTPDEQALTVVTQQFQRGVLLLVETAEGRFLYALTYNAYTNGNFVYGTGRYERFALPAP